MININGTKNTSYIEPEELINFIGSEVKLKGAIYKIRVMSGFAFIILRTRRLMVQCIYSKEFSDFPLETLKEEVCVIIIGEVVSEERSKLGYELRIKQVKILSTPAEELPVVINNKSMEASIETLLDYRPITLRNEKERAIFKLQEGICYGFRNFLSSENLADIPSIRFYEAKQMISDEFHWEIKDMDDFEPEEEKLLYELIKKKTGSEFVFVTHYPSKKRPFYAMDDDENPDITLSFDLIFRGVEITTGGQRIHSYEKQLQKMHSRGMNPDDFESYLMLHKYAVPPHGGLGLGLERFTSRLLEQSNVRYASLFPRDLKRLTP